jgi:hypothetical protein
MRADGQTDGQPDMTKLIVAFTILRKRLQTSDKQYRPS